MKSLVKGNPGNGSNAGAYNARETFAPIVADHVDSRVLVANVAQRHVIPDGARFVSFSSDGDLFVSFGDESVTATVPTAAIIDGSASTLNPGLRRIPDDVTHISLIANAARFVTLEFYAD